jgi:ribosomal protein L22
MAEERRTGAGGAAGRPKPKAAAKEKQQAAEAKAKETKPKGEAKAKETRPKGEAKAKGTTPKAKGRKPAAEKKEKPAVPVMVRASARYVRIAPRKARLVADQVRGLAVDEARTLLSFSGRGAARDLGKLLDSAVANAEANHDLIGDELRIAELNVDEGPTLRRYRPRALGRATRINKRTSHISVGLTPEEFED